MRSNYLQSSKFHRHVRPTGKTICYSLNKLIACWRGGARTSLSWLNCGCQLQTPRPFASRLDDDISEGGRCDTEDAVTRVQPQEHVKVELHSEHVKVELHSRKIRVP